MTKIVCISDLHGQLIEIPSCEILLIAGDICPNFHPVGSFVDVTGQNNWLNSTLSLWLNAQPAKHKVLVWGNHDWIGQINYPDLNLDCHILTDQAVELEGLKIWGTPWQPWFHSWAFNAPKEKGEDFLAEKYSAIPLDTDIIVSHGPPLGFGDLTPEGVHVGSKALSDVVEKIQPRLLVVGHIHQSGGIYQIGKTKVINASILDESYKMVNEPIYLEI